jgi:hypothetical protein
MSAADSLDPSVPAKKSLFHHLYVALALACAHLHVHARQGDPLHLPPDVDINHNSMDQWAREYSRKRKN